MPPVTLDFDISSLLDSDPGHMAGRPFIRGTRVSVQKVGILHREGLSPEEIADEMRLQLPAVHAALSFFLSRRTDIEVDLDEQEAEYFRLAEEHRRIPAGR